MVDNNEVISTVPWGNHAGNEVAGPKHTPITVHFEGDTTQVPVHHSNPLPEVAAAASEHYKDLAAVRELGDTALHGPNPGLLPEMPEHLRP